MHSTKQFLIHLFNVSSLTLLSRILGFTREVIQITCLGINHISDALTAALILPSMLRKLTSEGMFNAAFIPIYHEIQNNHSEKDADIWASNLLWMMLIYTTILFIIIELFMPFILSIFSSGFLLKPTWSLLITLSRIICISIIGSTVSSFLNTIWTAKGKFFLASIGSSICNIFIIICSVFATNVYQLSWFTALGTYAQFFCILFPLRHNIYWQKSPHKLYMKKFIKLMLPLLASTFLLQYLTIISAWFGSWLAVGEFTYINKASKLLQFPVSLIGITLSTVLIPTLLKQKNTLYTNLSVRIGLILACFIVSVIFIFHSQIAAITFGYGKLTTVDTNHIGYVLAIYSYSIPAWILLKIWHASLSSIHNTKLSLIGNIIHVSIYILAGSILLKTPNMHTLAWISVISVWCNCLFLTMHIIRKKLINDVYRFVALLLCFTICILLCLSYFSVPLFFHSILLQLILGCFYLATSFGIFFLLINKYKI